MITHNLCFEQKYEKYQNFLSEDIHFLVVKFSIYLNRHVFVMNTQFIVVHTYLSVQSVPHGSNLIQFTTQIR